MRESPPAAVSTAKATGKQRVAFTVALLGWVWPAGAPGLPHVAEGCGKALGEHVRLADWGLEKSIPHTGAQPGE
jgi:hypothetical protein